MANQYARDVLNGKILACKSIQLACQRHFNDLKISLDKDYPYRFDRELAERACRFVQLLPHSSGDLAGQKLKLEPWQAFAFSSIFGWVTKKTKKRRFREAYIRVARKNGKSFFAAGIGTYMFCADGENSAEVYCGATTMAQAKKVFTPARQMADRLPSLRSKFSISVWVDSLTRPDGSLFAPIAGNSLLQRLSCHVRRTGYLWFGYQVLGPKYWEWGHPSCATILCRPDPKRQSHSIYGNG